MNETTSKIASPELKERLKLTFGTTYLMLTSVLQGVLLAVLVTMIEGPRNELDPSSWVRVATSCLIAILVWNEYRMGATQFVWIPDLVDTLIPFSLAATQFLVIRFCFHEEWLWFLGLSGFYFAGLIAYENMYRRAKTGDDSNLLVLQQMGLWRYITPIACGIFCILCLVLGLFLKKGIIIEWKSLSTIILLCNLAFLVRGEFVWKRVTKLATKI